MSNVFFPHPHTHTHTLLPSLFLVLFLPLSLKLGGVIGEAEFCMISQCEVAVLFLGCSMLLFKLIVNRLNEMSVSASLPCWQWAQSYHISIGIGSPCKTWSHLLAKPDWWYSHHVTQIFSKTLSNQIYLSWPILGPAAHWGKGYIFRTS